MKKLGITILLLACTILLFAPPNCEVYRGDKKCFEACEEAMLAIRYRQGSYTSQVHFDKSIALCESFAYSYMEKGVPFLKRGQFIAWKKLIDKAVELEPTAYLGYRGWCRLQFLRDYEGAIADIEELKSMVNYDIGFCQTGDYHLNIALALCYKEIGEVEKARALFQEHIIDSGYGATIFDYYHWGVLEYEAGNYALAIDYLNRQIAMNDYMGETYYYLALAQKEMNHMKEYAKAIQKAKEYYLNERVRRDTYTETIDKIYLVDIEKELLAIQSEM